MKLNVQTYLEENSAWKNQILRILSDVKVEFPDKDVEVSVYNPGTGLITILFVTTKEHGELYIPNYSLVIKDSNEPIRIYFGGVMDCGQPLTFKQLLNKYYDGDLGQLLLSLTWGGRDSRDNDIIDDLGGAYRSFRCDIQKDDTHIFYELNNDRWRKSDPVNPILLFDQFLQKNQQNIKEMHLKILPKYQNGVFSNINVKLLLRDIADISKGESYGEYYLNAPSHCSICECSFTEEEFMIDGIVNESAPKGCICPDCYVNFGEDVNNAGGLYFRQGDRWLLVGGKRMVELENKILRRVRKEEDKKKKKRKSNFSKHSRRINRK